MNYTSCIVKIIQKPEQSFFGTEENRISVTEVLVNFYQFRNNSKNICKLSIWGNLSYDIIEYYQINDYLIVEGYLSRRNFNFEDAKIFPEIEISVFKIYPFVLNNT